MQTLSGSIVGIDISYDEKCGGNCDDSLLEHSSTVEDDDGSSYAVAFSDEDRDGRITEFTGPSFAVVLSANYFHRGPARSTSR